MRFRHTFDCGSAIQPSAIAMRRYEVRLRVTLLTAALKGLVAVLTTSGSRAVSNKLATGVLCDPTQTATAVNNQAVVTYACAVHAVGVGDRASSWDLLA